MPVAQLANFKLRIIKSLTDHGLQAVNGPRSTAITYP